MKIRKNRWTDRDFLKEQANRHGNLAAEHPQSRREMQSHQEEMEEALDNLEETCYTVGNMEDCDAG